MTKARGATLHSDQHGFLPLGKVIWGTLLAGRAIFWGGVNLQWDEQLLIVVVLVDSILLGLRRSSFSHSYCWLFGGYRRG